MKPARIFFYAARCVALLAFAFFACVPAVLFGQTATPPASAADVGSSAIGTAAAQTAVTFTMGSGGTLGTPLVLTQGTPKLDFQLGSGSTCVGNVTGSSCTVNVVFKPIAPGLRLGAIQLTNSTGSVIATAFIFGNGVGPRPVFTPGVISTVAGSYQACANVLGSCGDGGPATAAQFDSNAGIAVDAAGNMLIADRYDYRIRKVDAATGLISTVAGIRGKYCDPSTAPPGCYDGGPATQALLNAPNGVAIDGAGNFYITDSRDNVIRKVTASTGFISTVANGQPFPWGITVDRAGDVYWGDVSDNVIRKLTVSTGIVTTVAGNGTMAFAGDGGLATSASFQFPYSVAVDGAGNLYITDSLSDRIRKVSAATGIVTTIAGSGVEGYSGDGGAATSAALFGPRGIVEDGGGNLYFSDVGNSVIRKVDAAGIITTVAGGSTYGYSGDGGPAIGATLSPFAVAVDSADNLFIADTGNRVVREVTAAPAPVAFVSTTVGTTSTDSPQTVAVSNTGTAALTFAVPASGTNPAITAGYVLGSSGTCPQLSASGQTAVLAVGTSCTEVVSFHPVSVSGTNTGSLVLTDDSLNVGGATQSVALSGISTGTTGIVTPTLTLTVPTSAAPNATVGGTLQFSSSSASAPTGNVTIYEVASGSSTPIVLNTVVSSTAAGASGAAFSFAASATPGTYSIYASYAGDANFNSAQSANSSLTVLSAAKGTVTLSVYAPAGEVSGTAITGTVSAVFSGNTATPTGSVVVTAVPTSGNTSPSVVLGTFPATTLSTAGAPGVSLPYTAPAAGFYNVTASYVGDTNFNAATPAFSTIHVSPAATATPTKINISSVSSVTNTFAFPVTFTLIPTTLQTLPPTGNVLITGTSAGVTIVYATVPATAAIVSGGTTAQITLPLPGPYTLTATYAGDSNYGASTASIGINSNIINTNLTISAASPQIAGVPFIILTNSSQSSTVTGNVTLTAQLNGSTLGPVVATMAFSSSPRPISLTLTTAGTYTLTATYPGNTTNSASTSPSITVVVNYPVSGSTLFTMTMDDPLLQQHGPLYATIQNTVGTVATANVTLKAVGGYNTPVNLAAAFATPIGYSVTFIDASGNVITSAIPTTSGTHVMLRFDQNFYSFSAALIGSPSARTGTLGFCSIGLGLLGWRRRTRFRKAALSLLCAAVVVMASGSLLAGCSKASLATFHVTATAKSPSTSQPAPDQTVYFDFVGSDIAAGN